MREAKVWDISAGEKGEHISGTAVDGDDGRVGVGCGPVVAEVAGFAASRLDDETESGIELEGLETSG